MYILYITSFAMRTLIDIPDLQIEELKTLCQAQGLSRAELIRRAIAVYIRQHQQKEVDGFGLWKQNGQHTEDGLQYQKKLRDEW